MLGDEADLLIIVVIILFKKKSECCFFFFKSVQIEKQKGLKPITYEMVVLLSLFLLKGNITLK